MCEEKLITLLRVDKSYDMVGIPSYTYLLIESKLYSFVDYHKLQEFSSEIFDEKSFCKVYWREIGSRVKASCLSDIKSGRSQGWSLVQFSKYRVPTKDMSSLDSFTGNVEYQEQQSSFKVTKFKSLIS